MISKEMTRDQFWKWFAEGIKKDIINSAIQYGSIELISMDELRFIPETK